MPWTLPYPVSVVVWYALNVLLLFAGTHMLAGALEEATGQPAGRWDRRWWSWRVMPIVALLAAHPSYAGSRPGRGAAAFPAMRHDRGVLAKAEPAGRFLAGGGHLPESDPRVSLALSAVAARPALPGRLRGGPAVGLGAVPVAVFGPARTVAITASGPRRCCCRPWPRATIMSATTS